MPRRGENIYKRKDGRWEGRYIKTRTAEGKAKYGYVYAKNYRTVKSKLTQIDGSRITAEKYTDCSTYADLLKNWLVSKRIKVKASTFARYYRIVKVYLIPQFGSFLVCDLNMVMIEAYTQNLLVSGKQNGKGGLAPKTVMDILAVIKSSFAYGRDNGYRMGCNASRIAVKKSDKEIRVLTLSEQATLASYLRKDINLYKLGVLISLYTGIRIGELCALRWKHIHLDSKVIKISATLQRVPVIEEEVRTKVIITEPKSTCSIREIPIPQCLYPLLLQFEGQPQAYVLTGDETKFIEPRIMQYHFHQYIKKVGIAPANYHCLRHTFATRCVEAGFEIKSLSEILGHSSVNITLNRYVHSSFELKVANMNKLKF